MHGVSAEQAAEELLQVVPRIMDVIRADVRRRRGEDLSVAQFRTLAFLDRNPDISLSAVAEHIGLTLPSMSKLIDGLVERELVTRETCPGDRRRINLGLTPRGQATINSAFATTRAVLAARVAPLSEQERENLVRTMQELRPLFMMDPEPEAERVPAGETNGNP